MILELATQIRDVIAEINKFISVAVGGSEIIAGAATLSIIGSVIYLARKIPRIAYNSLKRRIFFTYVLEYFDGGRNNQIYDIASKIEHRLQTSVGKKRASSKLTVLKRRLVESLSNGGFFYKQDDIIVYVSRNARNKSTKDEDNIIKITLELTCLRSNREKLLSFLESTTPEYSEPGIYQVKFDGLVHSPVRVARLKRLMNNRTIVLDDDVENKIESSLEKFMENRKYENTKLVYMFYGIPGTGKSELGEYIAKKLNTSLFVINSLSVNSRHEFDLNAALILARENIPDDEIPVFLIDDFDTFLRLSTRKEVPEKDENRREKRFEASDTSGDLGKFLALLQSPVEVSDCIIVLTTNHLEKIDPAVYRPGRVTTLLEVGKLKPDTVKKYYHRVYKEEWPSSEAPPSEMRACDVSAYHSENKQDKEGFMKACQKHTSGIDEVIAQENQIAQLLN